MVVGFSVLGFLTSRAATQLAVKDDVDGKDGTWEIMARDRLGRRYKADGYAVFNDMALKYDPSRYLRRETGIDKMWLLDGLEIGQGRKEA